jgi:hypothetical protein
VSRSSFPHHLFTPDETSRSSNYPVRLSAHVTIAIRSWNPASWAHSVEGLSQAASSWRRRNR